MKQLTLFFVLICVFTTLSAYQNSSFSLFTPSSLNSGEAELNLAHRFYGVVYEEPLDTFFGMNDGANVNVSARYNIRYNLEAKAGYIRASKQYDLGVSMRLSPAEYPVQAQLDLQYFSFVQPGLEDRRDNFLYLLSAQNKPLYGIASLALNVGYDGYYDRFVNGIGLQLKLDDRLSVIGEYYPVWDRDSAADVVKQYMGKYDAYSFGIKANTYGHHFLFSLGNGREFSPARQSMGSSSNKLHLGFNIQRQFGM